MTVDDRTDPNAAFVKRLGHAYNIFDTGASTSDDRSGQRRQISFCPLTKLKAIWLGVLQLERGGRKFGYDRRCAARSDQSWKAPFDYSLVDGAIVDAPTCDHAFLNPTGRLVLVFTDDDGARLLDVARITALIAV